MNNIILSVGLFGSCYLFGKSLQLINESFLHNKNIPTEFTCIEHINIYAIWLCSGCKLLCFI